MLNAQQKYRLSKIFERVYYGFQYGLGFGLSFALLKILGVV